MEYFEREAKVNIPLVGGVGKTTDDLSRRSRMSRPNREQAVAIRNNGSPSTHLTSSVSVSSPLVQTTDSFSDSSTSLASHLSLRTLPAFRCLSLETIRPESSLIVRTGAATQSKIRLHNRLALIAVRFFLRPPHFSRG